jgi:hypothetical protein
LIGRGATSEVRQCVSRWSGDRLVIKTSADSAEAFHNVNAIHNELRILQQCVKVVARCPSLFRPHGVRNRRFGSSAHRL